MLHAMLIYMIVILITPGPNNLTMLYLGAHFGFKGTRRFLIASAAAFWLKAMLCGGLNLVLADLIPVLVKYLKWVGAAYMLYLAWVMAKSGWEDGEMQGGQTESTYRSGLILQLFNMKSWIGSLTLFAVYVIPYPEMKLGTFAVSAIETVLMIICSMCWGAFGSVMKSFITKYKKPFGIVMGLSLVYCAVTALM